MEIGFVTIREISEELNISAHTIKYFFLVLGIKPIKLVGHTGIYNMAVTDQLREELHKRGRLTAGNEVIA